jgi:apolipoprotein N-acyltransferase
VAQILYLKELALAWPRLTRLIFFLCGALLMLSFAPVGWFGLAPLLLLPLLCSTLYMEPRLAARHGFWYGAGLFLAGTYWIYISVHIFGEAPLFVAVFLMLALVVVMGWFYAATAFLISKLTAGHATRLLLAAPAAWVAIEWLRGWFLSGFPWMSLGYGQIDSTLAGFAPIAGVYGVSLVLMVSTSALLVAIVTQQKMRLVAASIAVFPWFVGALIGDVEWTSEAGPSVHATIVQGGVSQDRKWTREQFRPTLELYRNSIRANPESDLIIWPEVALPARIDMVEDYIGQLQSDINVHGQTLLFGVLEWDADAQRMYNSVVMIDGEDRNTRQIYRKRHLVPFGEYFPVPDFVREWMRLMSLPYSDMSAGDDEQPLLRMADGNQLAVAICYEDAYGAEQLTALAEATLLINVSNDAWFGESIAPHQHLEIARMRALEAGRYVVRATNNGVSAFIGPDGSLLQTGEQFRYVSMSHDVTPRKGLTPYAVVGNWPVVSFALFIVGWLAYRLRPGRE